jgi:hypothetical protein
LIANPKAKRQTSLARDSVVIWWFSMDSGSVGSILKNCDTFETLAELNENLMVQSMKIISFLDERSELLVFELAHLGSSSQIRVPSRLTFSSGEELLSIK